ncbi:MAG: hypothetical protein HFJ27_01895 [Clostridia bacterium]|nr:hypothetical protein [Clostridia bacterium]
MKNYIAYQNKEAELFITADLGWHCAKIKVNCNKKMLQCYLLVESNR